MPRIVSSWIWAGLRQGTDDPFASDLANAKSRSVTAEGPSAASIRTQHHRQSHGESRHPCSRGGANLPKVRDAGLAVRISCTRRDTARSAVLRACQGHSRSWSHFRFNQVPLGERRSVGLSCVGPQRVQSANELTSLRDVSEVHEFSKRRRGAVQFDVGGPGHSDVHGWHVVRQ